MCNYGICNETLHNPMRKSYSELSDIEKVFVLLSHSKILNYQCISIIHPLSFSQLWLYASIDCSKYEIERERLLLNGKLRRKKVLQRTCNHNVAIMGTLAWQLEGNGI